MKKLILLLVTMGMSAVAQASIYTCNTDTAQGRGGLIYLLVMDRTQHQVSIFSQSVGAIYNDSWALMHANAQMAYPMSPGSQYAVTISAQDNSAVNWDLVSPDTCFVHKIDGLNIQLQSNNGQEIKGTIQSLPSLERNPKKSQDECPLPMPYVAPPQALTCNKI